MARVAGFLAAFGLLFAALGASAQDGRQVAYRDGDGVWQVVDAADWDPMPPRQPKAFGDNFTLVFRDVIQSTGVGFDDPILGAIRQATAQAVMDYMSSVIGEPGSAEIEFQVSQTDGTGFAGSASPLFDIDLDAPHGFEGGYVYDHVTTDVDPDPLTPDGVIMMDFGWPWNSELDDPTLGELDLFSILLHELTHAVGFLSLMDQNGDSVLSGEDETGIFSKYDALLMRGSTSKMLVLDGGVPNATPGDLVSEDVVFAGLRATVTYGDPVPIYSPPSYAPGSSLSHWGEPGPVMYYTGAFGDKNREFLDYESESLADLGYRLVSCGDGEIKGGEQCDDGNQSSGDGCSSSCTIEDGWVCEGEPSVCSAAGCGDGFPAGDEECDDANIEAGDGCDACTVEEGYECTGAPSVCDFDCGDGLVLAGEVCDDGNEIAGDGCNSVCIEETGWNCAGEPSVCGAAECGDGIKVGAEECDDGGTGLGDGCGASCTIEDGWTCQGSPSSCRAAGCGDGFPTGGEQCDDGNEDSFDGCGRRCNREAGWTCTGSPSVCVAMACGDAVVAGDEECDDGNTNSGDGCDANCVREEGVTPSPNEEQPPEGIMNTNFVSPGDRGKCSIAYLPSDRGLLWVTLLLLGAAARLRPRRR